MTPHPACVSEETLDEATFRLRQAAVAEFPPGLVDATAEAIRREGDALHRSRGRESTVLRWAGIAAALLVALAGFTALRMSGGGNVAFADVINQAQGVDSVAFVLTHGLAHGVEHQQKCLLQKDRLRVEHPNGIVVLTNVTTLSGIYLDPQNKTACRFEVPARVAVEMTGDPISQLRRIQSEDAESLGMEDLDGRAAALFQVRGINLFGSNSDQGSMRIWVDPISRLPMKIELTLGETPLVTFQKLLWNPHVDPLLLKQEIPEGYVEQPEETFRQRLWPESDVHSGLTPTEAFRRWRESF